VVPKRGRVFLFSAFNQTMARPYMWFDILAPLPRPEVVAAIMAVRSKLVELANEEVTFDAAKNIQLRFNEGLVGDGCNLGNDSIVTGTFKTLRASPGVNDAVIEVLVSYSEAQYRALTTEQQGMVHVALGVQSTNAADVSAVMRKQIESSTSDMAVAVVLNKLNKLPANSTLDVNAELGGDACIANDDFLLYFIAEELVALVRDDMPMQAYSAALTQQISGTFTAPEEYTPSEAGKSDNGVVIGILIGCVVLMGLGMLAFLWWQRDQAKRLLKGARDVPAVQGGAPVGAFDTYASARRGGPAAPGQSLRWASKTFVRTYEKVPEEWAL
jgi:hypothetical protein